MALQRAAEGFARARARVEAEFPSGPPPGGGEGALTWDEFWTLDEREESVSTTLEGHNATLNALVDRFAQSLMAAEAALSYPAYRFDVPYGESDETAEAWHAYSERNRNLGYLVRLFALRARVRALQLDAGGALADCGRMLQIAGSVQHEPLGLSTQARRFSWEKLAVRTAAEIAGEVPARAASLRSFAAACEVAMEGPPPTWLMKAERARSYRDIGRFIESAKQEDWDVLPVFGLPLYLSLNRSRGEVLRRLTELTEAAELSHPYRRGVMHEMREWSAQRGLLPVDRASVGFALALLDSHIRTLAHLRVAALACNVAANMQQGFSLEESVGRVPLERRMDPFTDAQLKVVKGDGMLMVYSLGFNGQDDDGQWDEASLHKENRGLRGIADDIAFRVRLINDLNSTESTTREPEEL